MQDSSSGLQQPDVELGTAPLSEGPAAPQASVDTVLASRRQAVLRILEAPGQELLLEEQQPPPQQQDGIMAAACPPLNESKPCASIVSPAAGGPTVGGPVGSQAGTAVGSSAGANKDESPLHSNAGSKADGQASIGKTSSRAGGLAGSQAGQRVDQQQRIADVLEALLAKMNTWPPPSHVVTPPSPTMLELFKKGTDNSILVAILVATVAFSAFVAPPGGANASGRANATSDAAASGVQAALIVFMYSDALAFGLAVIASLICFMGLPEADDEDGWKARWAFIGTCVWFSAFSLAVAFLAAGYISFATGSFMVHWIVITAFVPGVIAFFALLFLVVACCKCCSTCCNPYGAINSWNR